MKKDQTLAQEIFELVVEKFPNGFRADYITEHKIRDLFKEKYDNALAPDCKIFDLLMPKAIESDERFYFFTEQTRRRLHRFVEKIFDGGIELIFYASLFEWHRDVLMSLNIWSVDVLKKLIRKFRQKYFCEEEYFSKSNCADPAKLIENILHGNELTATEIEKRLPYIMPRAVREILVSDVQILATKTGRYFLATDISFDEREILEARDDLRGRVRLNGYAILEPELLWNNIEDNPEIVEDDLLTAIYANFWSEDFSKNGRILTPKGKTLGTSTLIQAFCAERDYVTQCCLLRTTVSSIKSAPASSNNFAIGTRLCETANLKVVLL